MVYYGYWFAPEREALQALVDDTQKNVNGVGAAEALQGRRVDRRPQIAELLYDPKIASFEEAGGYNQADADGFIRLAGLRLRALARASTRKDG